MAFTTVQVVIINLVLISLVSGKIISPRDPHSDERSYPAIAKAASRFGSVPRETVVSSRAKVDWKAKAQNILTNQLNKNNLNKNKARNVIMFLGDGLSVATHMATRAFLGGADKELAYDKLPYVGLSKTYCVDRAVPDSACTSTAYTCGVKAQVGTLGVNGNVLFNVCNAANDTANHVHSIAKWAQDAGKATGFVTTTTVTHASPSGLYAHTSNRMWEDDNLVIQFGCNPIQNPDIATQLMKGDVGSKFNVIMGGGRQHFMNQYTLDDEGVQGTRRDTINLIDYWKSKHPTRSSYVRNKAELQSVVASKTDYLLGLFFPSNFPFNHEIPSTKPTLSDMVQKAVAVLSGNPNGYFLFVEGGLIDYGHHMTRAKTACSETAEFARALETARSMSSDDETLIVVTSDHSHTMTVSGYPKIDTNIFGPADTEPLSGDGDRNVADDGLPYSILTYANGPGYFKHRDGVNRKNLMDYDFNKIDYESPSGAPLDYETHGGDDVAIFATGPWSHLFSGVVEQNFIPHGMAFAACIGPGRKSCSP